MLKPLDFLIIFPALGAVIASFFWAYSNSGGLSVINLKGESGEWVFPADAVETMSVSGPLGDTIVEIGEGAARVLSSPCINQTCVAAGAIHEPGQWTACLPNRVMLYISRDGAKAAENQNDVDAAAW